VIFGSVGDPDPLGRVTDLDQEPSIIKQKQ
jgi:hypothetical protein